MSSSDARVDSPSAYQETCMEIAKLVADARKTGRQDQVIADLCSDPKKLAAHAEHHALMLLRSNSAIAPTYVMMSKAGDGLVIPLVLDAMPEEPETRIAIVAPLAFVLRLAPIDAYFLMMEMSKLVLILTFVNDETHKAIYRVVRHPETNAILAIRPLADPVLMPLDENPCLMNLYELADDILSQRSE